MSRRRRAALAGGILIAALVAVGLVVLLAGEDDQPPPRPPQAAPPPAPEPEPEPPGLAIGLGESNANLLWAREARPELPDPALAPWRDRVEALRPAYYRLLVDWAQLQPDPAQPADLAKAQDGCLRGQPPCGPYAGIREQLQAVRSQQEAHGGWEVVVAIYGVPDWAARPAGGCERPDALPRSRPITPQGLEGYRALIRSLADLARQERVELGWWAPWNEPNHPYFLSPQRRACRADSPPLGPRVYAQLVRAARDGIGSGRLVLGELAHLGGPRPTSAGIDEFVRALPDDVACAGEVWSQHAYAHRRGTDRDPVGELRRALDRRDCTRGKPIWVTETGAGGARAGTERDLSARGLRADCRAQARLLRRWDRDPRVAAAFQYTFREDTLFPVGLADAGLTRAYPSYELWRSWGAPDGVPVRCSRSR